jgi:hypothetical protein
MQPKYEVAHVLKHLGHEIEQLGLNSWQLRTLSALKACRTAELGGHIDVCDSCSKVHQSYNSCRNRHCPKCQGHKREKWISDRGKELLPVPYFHVVFTLPSELNVLAMHSPKHVYDSLFSAAWQTLQQFGKNKGLQMGMISILHTWGQNLSLHPHIHCIVPGGGINEKKSWRNVRRDGKFLFCVKAMSPVFRAKYMKELRSRITIDKTITDKLFLKNWVVYAKEPFGSPKSVLEYIGRYSHKIAISNHRLKYVDAQKVIFSYKDYRADGQQKTMSLDKYDFTKKFALHILPKGFVKIRHYGILSSTWKRQKLKDLQQKFKINLAIIPKPSLFKKCPCCKNGNLITIELFAKRGPPKIDGFGMVHHSFSCKK